MTLAEPKVTVIMPTWGRGRHIAPSIRSVLAQELAEFELIVAGDACTDETAEVVAGFADPRLRWINLPERAGTQGGPNNAAIAAARAGIIAYIGHDDIWEPFHLARVHPLFEGPIRPDFVVSGLIAHRPPGIPEKSVSGIFTDDRAKHDHFFPPSCVAHRRDVVDRIGPWRNPMEIRAPVDEDFLLRAAAADLRFVSTGEVTVHKFTAAYRYLCYLRQESAEQEAMLVEMAAPGHAERIREMVEGARRQGGFMPRRTTNFDAYAPGEWARQSAARRGVQRDQTQPLGAGAVLRQMPDACGYDWSSRPVLGIRLHGRNPRPRFLLPFTARGPVRLRFRAYHPDRAALQALALRCNDTQVQARPGRVRPGALGWTTVYETVIALPSEGPSILEFQLSTALLRKLSLGPRQIGFGLGRLWLAPEPQG
jgi:glycosyltransferase involved in cell wall biosynthesis